MSRAGIAAIEFAGQSKDCSPDTSTIAPATNQLLGGAPKVTGSRPS
jgi:hypothetical protein